MLCQLVGVWREGGGGASGEGRVWHVLGVRAEARQFAGEPNSAETDNGSEEGGSSMNRLGV